MSEHAPTAAEAEQDWRERLREGGYRMTPQRELVLRAVDRLSHATPDEVFNAVREHSSAVNVSTVYRTLELLEQLGLVRHTHISDRAPTYHSTRSPAHVHLVCRECGSVIEVSTDEVRPLTDRLAADHGFVTDVGHLTIFGTCVSCS